MAQNPHPAPAVRPGAPEDVNAIRALALQARDADGVEALNEASTFALDHFASTGDGQVLVALSGDEVVGTAVDAQGDFTGVDLVVAPSHRRHGAGAALVTATRKAADGAGFWAHGDLPGAQALAAATGLTRVRDLWRMSRPVSPTDEFVTDLPEGFTARGFDGSDTQAEQWLAVNAAAFAHHPEQGRMTMADFRDRTAQEWFDPDGLVLVWDETGAVPVLAGSHWTKREPGSDAGEVYVVAVAPAYQGRGLAKPLTGLGLEHLRRRGVRTIDLYVEGDNEPAKATYTRAGFIRAAQDALYARG